MWHRIHISTHFYKCAPLGITQILSDCSCFLSFLSRRAQAAHRAVPNEALYGDLRICSLISCAYLLFELLNKLSLNIFVKGERVWQTRAYVVTFSVRFRLVLLAPSRFEDLQVRWFLLALLGNGHLGRRVANRFQFSTLNLKCVGVGAFACVQVPCRVARFCIFAGFCVLCCLQISVFVVLGKSVISSGQRLQV